MARQLEKLPRGFICGSCADTTGDGTLLVYLVVVRGFTLRWKKDWDDHLHTIILSLMWSCDISCFEDHEIYINLWTLWRFWSVYFNLGISWQETDISSGREIVREFSDFSEHRTGLLKVNFDPALVRLLREVRFFLIYGLEVPTRGDGRGCWFNMI